MLVRRGRRARARGRSRTRSQAQAGINCFAVRGVRPVHLTPRRFPPRGPFFHLVEAKSIASIQGFASGKSACRRGAAGRFRARGRCGTPGHRLRLAMNCFAVRGVRPGCASHPTGGSRGGPFFHSVEADPQSASAKRLYDGRGAARGRRDTWSQAQAGNELFRRSQAFTPREVPAGPLHHSLLRRSQFAQLPCLRQRASVRRGRRALPAPVEMRDTRSQAQAGNKLFRRSRRPAPVAHLPLDRLGTKTIPVQGNPRLLRHPSTSSRNSAWFSAK